MRQHILRLLGTFIRGQMRLSAAFDRLLPARYRIDGNLDFNSSTIPAYMRRGQTICDVGGGKRPAISRAEKERLDLRIIGLDIDRGELDHAPPGSYDATICIDITRWRGALNADLVVSQAVLEHVRDTQAALRAMAEMLNDGGRALIFVPSRNALYARLNLLLPEGLKRRILFAIFPGTRQTQGFPSHYDRCTPQEFRAMAQAVGFTVEQVHTYYISGYFAFFFPAYLLWRLWILAFHRLAGDQAAETFSVVLRKESLVDA
jgi:2-polyprenyl-3-methyl-5-hydroxy-6-metoxy-1,4-benzoquinol methylase